jgi:hypothetical protein
MAGSCGSTERHSAMEPPRKWTARSNAFTHRVIAAEARFLPKYASQQGLEAYDSLGMGLAPRLPARLCIVTR